MLESTVEPDRYEIGELIAGGGQGSTLRGLDRETGREVAFKELRLKQGREVLGRLAAANDPDHPDRGPRRLPGRPPKPPKPPRRGRHGPHRHGKRRR